MAQLKAFLFAHCEKLVLALVALLALWSIGGNLMGRHFGIDREAIKSDLQVIERHVNRQRPSQGEAGYEVFRAASRVRQTFAAYTSEYWRPAGWDFAAYVQPPDPVEIHIPPPPDAFLAPPAQYLSRLDRPTDLRIRVGGRRVVLVWREGPLTQHRTEVRAAVFRKALGDGQEGAEMEAIRARRQREGADTPAEEGERPGGFGGFEGDGDLGEMEAGWGRGFDDGPAPPEEAPPAPEEGPVEPERPGGEAGEEAPEPTARYVSAAARELAEIREREEQRYADVQQLLDPLAITGTPWRIVARDVRGRTAEPDLTELLRGEDEEPAEAPDAGAEERSASGFETDEGAAAEEPLWFSFVDDQVEENTVYCYKVVVYARPLGLPESFLAELEAEEREGYDYYAPILRLGRTRLALPEAQFRAAIEAQAKAAREAGRPTLRETVRAEPLEFQELVQEQEVRKDPDDNEVLWWRLPGPMLKEEYKRRVLALHERPLFSQFAWSDVVLTPIRTRMEFHSNFGKNAAVIRVTVVDDEGEKHAKNFTVYRPEVPAEVEATAFQPGNPEALATMYEDVEPVPIGVPKEGTTLPARAGTRRQFDFRTGWGLVDIRDCTIVVKRYEWVPKRDVDGDVIEDEEGNPIREKRYKQDLTLPSNYIVVKELEGKGRRAPRIKPLLKIRMVTTPPEQGGEEIVVQDWNPGL